MEFFLQNFAIHVALVLEAISIVVITIGGAEAAYRVFWPLLRRQVTQGLRRGLACRLAAASVRPVSDPAWEALGQLGATALIRTFLNYFLERDLEAAEKSRETYEQPTSV